MNAAEDPTNYPAGYEKIVGRSAASTAPQLFQINWMRVFGGTLQSLHPQPNVLGGAASAPADNEPDGTAVTLAQPRAIAGKASSSMEDMLSGRTFTFIGEMKGDGDNCESKHRSDAMCQRQVPEDSTLVGNANLERPPKRPLSSSTPISRAIVPKSMSEQQLGRGSYTFAMDSSPETGSASEPFGNLCPSNLSFKRRYKPMQPDIAPAPEACPKIERADTATSERVYDSRVDKILQIMNTAETDYAKHRIRVTTTKSGNGDGDAKHASAPVNRYSYYALFFMVISNIVGVALSLNYQVLLFLKLNADRFLGQSWQHCQNVTLLRTENNIVTLLLMLPLIAVVLLAYVTIWAAYNLNRLLLTTVPDRLAQLINFNIQIVN